PALEPHEVAALGFEREPRRRVLERGEDLEELARVRAPFDAERALADGGQRGLGRDRPERALRVEPEPLEARVREDDGVEVAAVELAEARSDVASKDGEAEIGPSGSEL